MNIDDYRAMKAEMESAKTEEPKTDPVVEPTVTDPTPTTSEPTPTETTTTTEPAIETKLPESITIEGIGDVPLDELKNGYLRQSDYTKKTQEVAKERRQIEKANEILAKLQANPERAQELANEFGLPVLDPQANYVTELQSQLHDLLLEKEIASMEAKYPDFNATEVLQVAFDKKLPNLEDAYMIVKAQKPVETPKTETPSIDVKSLKEEIRQEILKELELESNTVSIISTNGGSTPKTDNTPTLSEGELRVARAMRLSPEEYAKWKG